MASCSALRNTAHRRRSTRKQVSPQAGRYKAFRDSSRRAVDGRVGGEGRPTERCGRRRVCRPCDGGWYATGDTLTVPETWSHCHHWLHHCLYTHTATSPSPLSAETEHITGSYNIILSVSITMHPRSPTTLTQPCKQVASQEKDTLPFDMHGVLITYCHSVHIYPVIS